ncbi:MAG: ATP phosphoribosyltransferase regulatory subunit, partial [Thermacetogeniaceae bacterium]
VLSRIEGLLSHPKAQKGIARLRDVWEILGSYGSQDQVCIDLTLLRGLGYYTGIVFEGYTSGVGYPLCGGGRYDALLAKFGFDCPATGFALGIERIMAALEKEELHQERVPDYYVIGSNHQEVIRQAKQLRDSGFRVEIDVTGLPRERAIAAASRRGIPHILVVE